MVNHDKPLAPESVTCKVKPVQWALSIGCSLLLGHMIYTSWQPANNGKLPPLGVSIGFSVFLGLGIVFLITTVARSRVTGDASGLTWTSITGTYHADWPQVRNIKHGDFKGKPVVWVETDAGRFHLHPSLSNREELCAMITKHTGLEFELKK